MSYIDIILLLLLLYGAFKGFKSGFIVEIATLVALVLGVFIAIKFSGITEKFLIDYFNIRSKYLAYISLGVTFILVALGIYLLGKILTKLADIISLGLMNKIIGAVFGVAKAAIVLCVIIFLFDLLDDKLNIISEETKAKSFIYSHFLTFAQQVYNLIRF
ncbi:CvpA family protein [Porphyromonadaceae bacterium OttesenSCG-928-L07]|nr:CvpA family protein [Porphyromonadaceae bacterium OttesenSCG-928-L07]